MKLKNILEWLFKPLYNIPIKLTENFYKTLLPKKFIQTVLFIRHASG